jgi:hypothetical protein
MFYESIQPAKNTFNAGFFCGTSAVLRRKALDSVGGFATGTATEDIHTSLRLHAKGWNSLFLSEKLCHGLAPEDLKEYHQQRVRWGAGSLGLLFRTSDSPLVKRGLTLMQRLSYLNSTNAYFYGGIVKLFYILMPVIIIFSLPFLRSYDGMFLLQYLAIAVPFVLISNLVTYIYSRRTFHILYTEQYNIANIFSCIEALKGVLKVQKKFRVSLKSKMLRENHIAYYFISGLFVILLASEIFGALYWFEVLHQNTSEFFNSFDAIALFWNTWNLVIVGSFLYFLQNYSKKKRVDHAFVGATPVTIASTTIHGNLKNISLKGATLLLDLEPKTKKFELIIRAEKEPIHVAFETTHAQRLAHGKYELRGTFQTLSSFQRHQLITFFFTELVQNLFSNDFKKLEHSRSHSLEFLPHPTPSYSQN